MTIYGHTMSYSNYHMPYGHTLYCIWLVYECYFLILSPITIVYSICLQAGPTNKHNSGCDPYSELTRDYSRVSACGQINPYSECRNRNKQTGIRETREHWNGAKLGHCVFIGDLLPHSPFRSVAF